MKFIRAFFARGRSWLPFVTPLALDRDQHPQGTAGNCYKSIKTDMINAGAKWEDVEVVADQGIVTSRNPGDLEAFSRKIMEEIAEGKRERRAA